MAYDAVAVLALMMLATAALLPAGVEDVQAGRDPLYTLYLCGVWFLYLGWCWRYGGMTIGMRAWRVRIDCEDGGRPGWGRCLARFGLALVSAAAAGAGFLWALADPRRRTWHDRATRTRLTRT